MSFIALDKKLTKNECFKKSHLQEQDFQEWT